MARGSTTPWWRRLGLLAAGGVGAACGYFGVHVVREVMPEVEAGWLPGVLALVSLPLAFLLAVAVHECGHLLAGLLRGGRFLLLIVGPLRLASTRDGLRWGRNRSFPLFGGLASVAPRDASRIEADFGWLIAGGPLASLAGGAVLVATGLGFGSVLAEPVGAWTFGLWFLCLLVGGMSLGLGVLALVPNRTAGFPSDGARLLSLWRGGPKAAREAALFALVAMVTGGVRSRDLPDDLVARATDAGAPADGGTEVAARLIAYSVALDRGDAPRAAEHLRAALPLAGAAPALLQDGLMLEWAYFQARHLGDAAGARQALARAGAYELSPETRLRAEAALALAECRWDDAAGRAEESLAARGRGLSAGASPETEEWSRAMLDDARRLSRRNPGRATRGRGSEG
jgi:hypothetical protein